MSDHPTPAAENTAARTESLGSTEASLGDLARPRLRNRSSLLVAIAVGVALFVLVASAFSVAAESRVVATKSNQLHTCDEILRAAITTRSQLGSAVNFAQLDLSQETDSSPIINSAVADARTSLGAMQNESSCIPTDERAEAGVAGEFANAAGSVAALLESGDPDDLGEARSLLIGDMDVAYQALIDVLIAERETLVASLTEADESLGQLGALATFIIAFFVPTVAMFVYRQITRRQRETIELARLLSETRTANEWRSDLIHSASKLAAIESAALPASSIMSSLRSRLDDLQFLVGAASIGHRYTFETLSVADITNEVHSNWPTLVSVAGGGTDSVWADRRSLVLLCNDLVRNASRRGAQRVLVSGGLDADGIWIAITDNGSQIDAEGVALILESPSLIDATDEHMADRLDADTSLVLILGRMIAPALGGSFGTDTVGTNNRFTIRLPASRNRRGAARLASLSR